MRGTQVSTGDAWASTVARNLITGIGIDGDYDNEHPVSASMVALVGFFFASYVLVVGVVLMNIVIAVLLDEFISTVEREKQEAKARRRGARHTQQSCGCGSLGPSYQGPHGLHHEAGPASKDHHVVPADRHGRVWGRRYAGI